MSNKRRADEDGHYKKMTCCQCGRWDPLVKIDGEEVCEPCAIDIIGEYPELYEDL